MKRFMSLIFIVAVSFVFVGAASALSILPQPIGNPNDKPQVVSPTTLYQGNDTDINTIDGKTVYKVPDLTYTGIDKNSGNWSANNVDYISVKFGNYFIVYDVRGLTAGEWETVGIQIADKTKYFGMSHITGWSTNSVPIPAAVWLLGTGLVGLFGIRRKLQK